MTNTQGEPLFEFSKEGEVSPKNLYRPDKENFVFMEKKLHHLNTLRIKYKKVNFRTRTMN